MTLETAQYVGLALAAWMICVMVYCGYMDTSCPVCKHKMRKTPPCDYVCDYCGYID